VAAPTYSQALSSAEEGANAGEARSYGGVLIPAAPLMQPLLFATSLNLLATDHLHTFSGAPHLAGVVERLQQDRSVG
jgi:hypothetical protein